MKASIHSNTAPLSVLRRNAVLACLVLSALFSTVPVHGDATFVAGGATWKYLDNGTNQGTAWRDPAFNDGLWKQGPAQLGYGDGDEATVISYGSSATAKYITTYLRHTFTVEDPASFESVTVRLLRDDGAVVYLNGVEIGRSNMPAGAIGSSTPASSAIGGADESTFYTWSVGVANLVSGPNVLAVELHQSDGASSDLSFDLELVGVTKVPSITVVPAGSTWRYLDQGTYPGSGWIAPAFDDGTWSAGNAELGYGDGGERTLVSFGPSSTAKYITTYFRQAFEVADPAVYKGLKLRLMRDDGAVVYLNGAEILRSNMPSGAVTASTLASSAVADADELAFFETSLGNALLAGTNVLAVEVHQNVGTSSDLSFDLELLGLTESPVTNVTRGPYLQNATPTSMVVRWRTDVATSSKVWVGATAADLSGSFADPALATEHEVEITGLTPDTQYFYAIGSSDGVLASGSEYAFFTPLPAGSTEAFRVWVLGDSGTANANAAAVRNAYTAYNGDRYTDMWLMLGDNAYNNGTDAEFQAAVFNMYPAMLRQSPLWSTLGNHEHYTAQGAPYFDIHTFPTQGEAGGQPSGTEKFYSFDYGNVHFICLDSMSSDRSATGPMANWLRADLEATDQSWIIAFWHHPPYSKGSHDSDNSTASDVELVQMRQNFLPLLEAGGVDLVLGGHSHSYERSYLIDGHYGYSTSFSNSMKKAAGNGQEIDGVGAYRKPTGLPASQGAVYAVAGSSGKKTNWWGGSTEPVNPTPHPAMVVSLLELGSMILDVNGSRLDVKFLNASGSIDDAFTILKDVVNTPPVIAITSPAEGAKVIAPLTITTTATPGPETEGGSVTAVEFYSGGTLIGSTQAPVTGSSFEFAWSNPSAGTHVLSATAWDDLGASTTSAPVTITVNSAPSVSIASPAAGSIHTAPASIEVAANASDLDGSVAQVAFYAGSSLLNTDGEAPFAFTWSNVAAGTYQLTAVATDDSGVETRSSAVSLTVNAPNQAPSVSVTSPTSGSRFTAPATVQLSAAASDADGTVQKVVFYRNSTLLFTDTAAPYAFSWSNVSAGSYQITAVATDNRGASTTSAAVAITVEALVPPTAPSALAATAITKARIDLKWTDHSTNEKGFQIERSTSSGFNNSLTRFTVGANVSTYASTGLKADTQYYYRVRATNDAGVSAFSNTLSVRTLR
jgi:hypothetical protein